MIEQDILQRFLFEDEPVRLEIVRLQQTYRDISINYEYPLSIQRLLGEALAATALLSATIKFLGKLTLQIQSPGPINLLVTQGDHHFRLRGLAKWEGDLPEDAIGQTFAEGHLGIIIAPESGEQYQGIVKLSENGLSESLETYFAQSEQLLTGIHLASDGDSVIGILMQIIPGNVNEDKADFCQELFSQIHKLDTQMLLTSSNETILQHLSLGKKISLVAENPVSFYCDCTIGRMERAIQVLGYEEAHDILKTNKFVTVTCEFCNKTHDFDAIDVSRIFIDGDKGEDSDTRH